MAPNPELPLQRRPELAHLPPPRGKSARKVAPHAQGQNVRSPLPSLGPLPHGQMEEVTLTDLGRSWEGGGNTLPWPPVAAL